MRVNDKDLARLNDLGWFVLFMVVFARDTSIPRTILKQWTALGEKATHANMGAVCTELVNIGALVSTSRYGGLIDCDYAARNLDYGILVALLKRSVDKGWWRVFAIDSNSGISLEETPSYYYANGLTSGYNQEWALCVRALIDASGLLVNLGAIRSPTETHWTVAFALETILDAQHGWKWTSAPIGQSNPLSLHLRYLYVLFTHGKDIRSMLEGLLATVTNGKVKLDDCELCEVVSLAVLTGIKADWSCVRGWKCKPEAQAFAGIEAVLRSGDMALANKLCTAAFKEIPGLASLDAPAFNVLSSLVVAVAKSSPTRVLQHLRALCPSDSYKYYQRSYAERELVDDRNSLMRPVAQMTSKLALSEMISSAASILGNIAYPLESLVNGMSKKTARIVAKQIVRTAEYALTQGYPTIAGFYLAVFGWAMPEESRTLADKVANGVTEANGVWLLPFDKAHSAWKRALGVLSDRLPKVMVKSASATKVKSGSLIWKLDLSRFSEDGLCCRSVGAQFRGPRAAQDGSEDKSVTLKSVFGGKYDDCLSDADKAVVTALNKVGYAGARGMITVPAAALEAMCGQDNLKVRLDSGDEEDIEYKAVSFVRQEVPVVGKPGEDGLMRLMVPAWSLGLRRTYVIRSAGANAYAYYPLGREVRDVLDVFRDYGDAGTIDLPKEALTTARPILRRLAAVLPLQGALADVAGDGEGDGLTRIKGETKPLVRLAMEELRLHISLKVRPISSSPGVLFEPGVGQTERTMKLANGPVILVRDLAAEKAGAAKVEKVLAEYEGDRDGANEWQIDEPTTALEVLAGIHALGSAAHVEWQPGRKVSVATPQSRPNLEASLGADEWFAVSGEWKLDDGRLVSFAKLLDNFDRRVGRFVPIDEKGYLALNRALLRQLEAMRAAGQVQKGKIAVSPAALPMLDGAFAAEGPDALALPKAMSVAAERIREVFAATPAVPGTFKGSMRPYQEEGYQWLSRLCDCRIGCCLADDMGLGKTIQLIALLAAKRSGGPSLVIAPASVAFNWRNELARFAPSLRVALVGQTAGAGDEDVAKLAKGKDVVITSYGVAASRLASFVEVQWNAVVLDEAQAIKNHLTQRAKSVKELKARFRVAATGTPVENRLTELWSIFDFLNPGMLGGETRFLKELAPHGEASPRLKRLVKPLILRRIKRDVLTDLPEKEEITVPVILGDEERHAYEATRLSALAKLEEGDKENKIAILAELTRLRRFCCNPSLVIPTFATSAKLEALERLLTDLKENGHRALVFSQFVDFLAIVRKMLDGKGWTYQYLDGATSKAEREKSVEAFQGGEGDFFLISLKAGGMGLNLTSANYVILLDPWWNPAVENQAADRVHRIGQRLPVTVYRLIAQDTIEEKVVNLHAKKTALAEDILASGASALSAEAMLGLLEG